MKTISKFLGVLTLFVALPAFASFELTGAQQSADKIQLTFLTHESFDFICRFSIDQVTVISPYAALESALVNERKGVVEIEASVRPDARCFTTSGSHSGKIELDKGEGLPRLTPGETYQIVINGHKVQDILVH